MPILGFLLGIFMMAKKGQELGGAITFGTSVVSLFVWLALLGYVS
jgi:hypothetical protein